MELIPITDWKKIDPNGIVIEISERSPLGFKLGTVINPEIIWNELASLANESQMRFKLSAAIVCKKGKLLGKGFNSNKTHPKFGSKAPFYTIHAEGSAIIDCVRNRLIQHAHTIYVYRKNFLTAKPCHTCMEMLKKIGIQRIFYTNAKEGKLHRYNQSKV